MGRYVVRGVVVGIQAVGRAFKRREMDDIAPLTKKGEGDDLKRHVKVVSTTKLGHDHDE